MSIKYKLPRIFLFSINTIISSIIMIVRLIKLENLKLLISTSQRPKLSKTQISIKGNFKKHQKLYFQGTPKIRLMLKQICYRKNHSIIQITTDWE